MRWFWQKRPPPPAIPAYEPIKLDFKPLEPRDPAYVVEERDMSEKTGMFYFPWLKKKGEPKD